jgi:hypothetical protein
MLKRFVALSLVLSLLTLPVLAQNGSGEMLTRIRAEAMDRSQIMKTMHMFTDLYGPRLTGSPNHKAAAEWAVKQKSGLAERATLGASHLARERSTRVRSTRVDAEHERHRAGKGDAVTTPGTTLAGTVEDVFRQQQDARARSHRARRQARGQSG